MSQRDKITFLWIAVLYFAAGFALQTKNLRTVEAQNAQAATFVGAAAHTTCLTPVAGSYFLCVASDGVWVSNSGAAYFQLTAPGVAATPSITLNGVTKNLPASFTIAGTAPNITAQ